MIFTAYRRLLYWLSFIICAVSLTAAFISAVRIYPAFGFLGVLSAEDKIGLMKKTAVYTVAGAVCLLLTESEQKKLSRRTVILTVVCALLPPFGIALFSFQQAYLSSYQIAALCFYIIPLTFTSALSDFIGNDIGRKYGSRRAVMAFFGALLLLICSLAAMYLISGSVMLLPVILYAMLPFIIFTDIIVLLNRPVPFISRRTVIILFVNAAVMPVCNIVLPYNTEVAIITCGWMLITGTIISIISTLNDIRRKADHE
jgi:hypothetical protein